MILRDNLIFVGIILSAYATQGNVIVKSFTIPVTNITKLNLVNEVGEDIVLTLIRQNSSNNLICQLNKITNRTEAEKLKGYRCFCLRSNLPQLTEDTFYVEDLKGLVVLDKDRTVLGSISNIFNFGAGDIIEIEFTEHKIELFPFTKDFFPIITQNYIILNKNL